MVKLFYDRIIWDSPRCQLTFVNPFLSAGKGKRYEVNGTKQTVYPKQKLYLCKIKVNVGRHEVETFKFYVLDEITLDNFPKENVQLVGTNKAGKFMFDAEFAEGLVKNVQMSKVDKIKLSEFRDDAKADRGPTEKGIFGL